MPTFTTAVIHDLTFDMDDLEVNVKSSQLWDGDVLALMIEHDAAEMVESDDNLSDLMVSRRTAVRKAIRNDDYAVVCFVDAPADITVLDVQLATL